MTSEDADGAVTLQENSRSPRHVARGVPYGTTSGAKKVGEEVKKRLRGWDVVEIEICRTDQQESYFFPVGRTSTMRSCWRCPTRRRRVDECRQAR